jgi:DNA-binding NtrC family response regulator
MPARIVLVHDDQKFLDAAATALRRAGYEVAGFLGSMAALDALQEAKTAELLITRLQFAPGAPNGLSLALIAKTRRPELKVLFTAQSDTTQQALGIGEVVRHPVNLAELVDKAATMLAD